MDQDEPQGLIGICPEHGLIEAKEARRGSLRFYVCTQCGKPVDVGMRVE